MPEQSGSAMEAEFLRSPAGPAAQDDGLADDPLSTQPSGFPCWEQSA